MIFNYIKIITLCKLNLLKLNKKHTLSVFFGIFVLKIVFIAYLQMDYLQEHIRCLVQ